MLLHSFVACYILRPETLRNAGALRMVGAVAMRDFSVIAIIAAYNEADIIGQVVRHRRVSARAQAAGSRVTR
jgi:hypothetical protein